MKKLFARGYLSLLFLLIGAWVYYTGYGISTKWASLGHFPSPNDVSFNEGILIVFGLISGFVVGAISLIMVVIGLAFSIKWSIKNI